MSKYKISLGLDISSTVVGYAFSTSKKKIVDAGFIDISNEISIRAKAHKKNGD